MAGIFEYTSGYVEVLANFDAERARKEGRVKGVHVKLFDTDQGSLPLCMANKKLLQEGKMKELRDLGYSVGGWACPRLDPEGSVPIISQLYVELGLSYQVFETEWEYKTDGGKVDVERLLAPWRVLRPNAYTACATTGEPPTTFNHKSVQKHNCWIAPENYWLQNSKYDMLASTAECIRLGYFKTRIVPTVTGVEGHDLKEAFIRAYRAQVNWYNGIMLWRMDQGEFDDEAWRIVGLAMGLSLR